MLKTSYWYRFHPFYLSFSPGCDLNTRECFDGPAAPQQGMLGALIVWWPASFWLQWTMADGTVHTGSPAKFSTKPTEEWKKIRKMYAIKQIKICAEYRDMLPRPRLDLSGTPGLRPIGLSPGSWQTSLGLGSMSRYSAQILICIAHGQQGLVYTIYSSVVEYSRLRNNTAILLIPKKKAPARAFRKNLVRKPHCIVMIQTETGNYNQMGIPFKPFAQVTLYFD